MPRRAGTQLFLLCLVVFLSFLPLLRYPQPRCDDIYYLIGAKSLAAGLGYCDISRPDLPPLTKYAPLPSVLLAPFVQGIGENIALSRLVSMVFCVFSMPLYYGWLRGRTSHFGAMCILALVFFHPMTFHGMTLQGNTGVANFLVAGIFLLADRGIKERPSPLLWFLFGLFLVGAFYTHRSLIAILISQILFLIVIRRQLRLGLWMALGVLGGVLPWMWRSYRLTGNIISREYETEFIGRIQDTTVAQTTGSFFLQTVGHIVYNIPFLPLEIGYGLFPWSRGPGGTTWGLLVAFGGEWLVTVSAGLIFTLVGVGWWHEWRTYRGAVEWHLPFHVVMLLVFYVIFAYFGVLAVYLYLYLWRGFRVGVAGVAAKFGKPDPIRQEARGWAILGVVILLIPMLGKDLLVFYGRGNAKITTREPRWAWVERVTPPGSTVYWENLDNYAWSCWRWYDSQRMAVGVKEADALKAVDAPESQIRFIAAVQEGSLSHALASRGWKPVYQEPPNLMPPPEQREAMIRHLAPSEQEYVRSLPPSMTLWARPEPGRD